MTVSEILALVPAVVGAYIAWLLVRQPRRPNRLAVRPPTVGPIGRAGDSGATPKPIPAALKAELDQTPEWWERQFHQLLAAVAAPAVVDDVIEISDYSGRTLVYDEIKGWRDCTCPSCRRICR